MRAHVLQHVPFEGIGSMADWLNARAATITYTRFYQSAALPELGDIDLIIAMGGPMSVNDEATLPWLIAEKQFIRDAVAAGVPIVGICLGSQLIASALGARIYPNRHREIGWLDIEAVPADAAVLRLPSRATVFHWHGETFDLPNGAVRLASSAGCVNQAFQIGRNVIGLQFHLETTPQSAALLVEHCRDELIENTYVQSERTILGVDTALYTELNRMMAAILDYVTR